MKNKYNLFNHLPRELSADAFLMWLFNFINRDEQLRSAKANFFETLVLNAEDRGKPVSELFPKRKEKGWERQSDIVLDFKLNGDPKTILFETQIAPMTTLRGYEKIYPNLYACIYLKTGGINYQERSLAEKHGYLVRDMETLLEALEPLADYSGIIQHYCQYLEPIVRDSAIKRRGPGHDLKSDDFYSVRSKYMKMARRI